LNFVSATKVRYFLAFLRRLVAFLGFFAALRFVAMVFSLDWLRYCVWYYRFGFSAAFSVLLGLNFIVVEAAIWTGSPVRGLRPVRAWRCDVENEPKPGHDTLSPLFAASTTSPTNAEMTASACADETPVFAATAARRSAFVIGYFSAFSESEFRSHQVERTRRRIASILANTSREPRLRRTARASPQKRAQSRAKSIICRILRMSTGISPRDSRMHDHSTVRKSQCLWCVLTPIRKSAVVALMRARQHSSHFVGRTRGTESLAPQARNAAATASQRSNRGPEKNFWPHERIHREIAQQSTTASPHTTKI
jgi:hypothetical protein